MVCLLAAIRDPDPVVFLEPTRLYRALREEVEDDGAALPLDHCFVLREGTDITLVTWGAMVKETLATADRLAEDGVSAEVVDVATLKPLDTESLLASVGKTGRCIIIHEAPLSGGLGGEIAARLAERGHRLAARTDRARRRLGHGDAIAAARAALPAERSPNPRRRPPGAGVSVSNPPR